MEDIHAPFYKFSPIILCRASDRKAIPSKAPLLKGKMPN